MTVVTLPAALYAEAKTLDEAKAWIRALVDNDLSYHFEDSASDCLSETGLDGEQLSAVQRGCDALYEIEDWGVYECPIGYMMAHMKVVGRLDFWTLGEFIEYSNGQMAKVEFVAGHGAVLSDDGRFMVAVTTMEDFAEDNWGNPVDDEADFATLDEARAALAWTLALTEYRSPV